jgi:aminoglycoside phosphotransferase (APT) family kinase protein
MTNHDDVETRFSAETARATLERTCTELGLATADAKLIRMGENAMFALRAEKIVVRIARTVERRKRVERELAVARWLADNNFPAVRVAEEFEQPRAIDGRLVTFWHLVDESGKATFDDLAGLLRDMHSLPTPTFELPQFDPFTAVPGRLANPGSADETAVAFLTQLYDEVRGRYANLAFPSPFGVIHGDAHRGNVIPTVEGPLLADFEVVAWGPREWDLTPTAMSVDRFGLPRATYESFARTYGRDVTTWPDFSVLRSTRELTMVTWLMQIIDESPERAREFYHRVGSLRDGKPHELWHAF